MIPEALTALLTNQNPDGGWPARRGNRSNTEVTALALLALRPVADGRLAANAQRGLQWLTGRQTLTGAWPMSTEVPSESWATALAILALASFGIERKRQSMAARWLLGQEPRGLGWVASLLYRVAPDTLPVRLDPDLKGWSWTTGAFSWVEPTAYALLALKKLRRELPGSEVETRILEAERMLYDRACEGGGWNYGNPVAFRTSLPPYPDTTALALLALQDHRAADVNQRGLAALRRLLTDNPSGLALSWSIICLSLYGQDTADWSRTLERTYRRTGFLGETRSIALALLASGEGGRAFGVTHD
jgi:Prenyltransferase and squalene oxidase repeat